MEKKEIIKTLNALNISFAELLDFYIKYFEDETGFAMFLDLSDKNKAEVMNYIGFLLFEKNRNALLDYMEYLEYLEYQKEKTLKKELN